MLLYFCGAMLDVHPLIFLIVSQLAIHPLSGDSRTFTAGFHLLAVTDCDICLHLYASNICLHSSHVNS